MGVGGASGWCWQSVAAGRSGAVACAVLVTLGGCGQGNEVTFSPAGQPSSGAPSASAGVGQSGVSAGAGIGDARAQAGVGADGGGVGASASAGIGGLGAGAGVGIASSPAPGTVAVTGAVNWKGTVTGGCLRAGVVRRVVADLGKGVRLTVNTVSAGVGHLDLADGGSTYSANWVGDSGAVSLGETSLTVNDVQARHGAGTVRITATFSC